MWSDITKVVNSVSFALSSFLGNTNRSVRNFGHWWFRFLGHIAGHADLGNDQHYGRLGERSVKQVIVDGYNDEDCTGSAGRAASICERLERRLVCFCAATLSLRLAAAHQPLLVAHDLVAWLLAQPTTIPQ